MQETACLERFKPLRKKKLRSYQGPIGDKVFHLVAPLLNGRGFVEGKLLRDWEQIVGPQWSLFSCPEKIFFPPHKREEGTMHIRVWGGAALELQHQSLSILDRINRYFGYKAIASFSLKQVPSPLVSSCPAPIARIFCTQEQKKRVADLVQAIPHEALQKALVNLGEALFAEGNSMSRKAS